MCMTGGYNYVKFELITLQSMHQRKFVIWSEIKIIWWAVWWSHLIRKWGSLAVPLCIPPPSSEVCPVSGRLYETIKQNEETKCDNRLRGKEKRRNVMVSGPTGYKPCYEKWQRGGAAGPRCVVESHPQNQDPSGASREGRRSPQPALCNADQVF